ncbi:elongation factor P 5-aminopentanone reductase [Shouchella patagoniensis]|uniref:elongation factor P 5-aminopentanone reductase n=1 Tax=Shouchella patagoniensis TaxID=228576 RepID=UPI00099587AB|nr:SDR family oxidoreductase [Shouchella patagoniensis]
MRRVLVTGATGGIGKEVVRSLEDQAELIYIHYHTNRNAAEELMQRVNCECMLVFADLSQGNGVDSLLSQMPVIPDTLIYCAGTSVPELLQDVSDEELDRTMAVHLISPIKLVRALLPQMIRNESGSIVVVSSIWGLTGASMESVYSAAKSGLHGFVKAIAKEVGRSGVRINAVAPGAIATEMLSLYPEDDLSELANEIPAGRLGTATETANAIHFLAGNKATYINGQILSVNGAWYC